MDYPHVLATQAAQSLRGSIDTVEASAQQQLSSGTLSAPQQQIMLGEALVFDRSLSVNGSEACAMCHSPASGFAGGLTRLTYFAGTFPGAVPFRTGNRAPQSMAYAAFAPVLSFDGNGFSGGNFRDSRATGLVTGNPAADQAAGPLTGAAEMALPDAACAVRRVSLSPYAASFTQIWGSNAFAITWPADTDQVCARPNNGAANQTPLALSAPDRAQATTTFHNIGLTIAAFESSPLVSPFNSKFDAVLAGAAKFKAVEQAGFSQFNAHCSRCHSLNGSQPLLTNYNSFNIGVPRNAALSFYIENVPDARLYNANPAGANYVDPGLGGYLASAADTNSTWQAQASRFLGAFQVPTLRNVAAGARRSYMHNGFFNTLKMVVHFYNTRDVLPQCTGTSNIGVGVSCWPAPEQSNNEDGSIGNMGMTNEQEESIVAFMQTLTDGYTP